MFRTMIIFALSTLILTSCNDTTGQQNNNSKNSNSTSSKEKLDRVETEEEDPPEVLIGERLFLETRFAQYFFAHSKGDANAKLEKGDPVVAHTTTVGKPLTGPFAGRAINCRACHLVDEHRGNRTYADFARRSPIPNRNDGKNLTLRNSPALVNAFLAKPEAGFFLHFDGEFSTVEDLVTGTMTGRNFGWLPLEKKQAITHIANVIRNDDGKGELAKEFGGSYSKILKGTDEHIEDKFLLPEKFRIDVSKAKDREILDTIATLVTAYLRSLEFLKEEEGKEKGAFNGSPYDIFLRKNGISRQPTDKETPLEYSQRLLTQIEKLTAPKYVTVKDGKFKFHSQKFIFGPQQLAGLKIFFRQQTGSEKNKTGNCIACHMAPLFTDFKFHNTGHTQEIYDNIHGTGAFAKLDIPNLAKRNKNYALFLQRTVNYPDAKERFASIPSNNKPGYTDLGVWNVFANDEFSKPQKSLQALLKKQFGPSLTNEQLLQKTIATFKTPNLRDLGQSAPFMHSGAIDSLEEVVTFYFRISTLAREGKVRNAASELKDMFLAPNDIAPLTAFLKALNEDYE